MYRNRTLHLNVLQRSRGVMRWQGRVGPRNHSSNSGLFWSRSRSQVARSRLGPHSMRLRGSVVTSVVRSLELRRLYVLVSRSGFLRGVSGVERTSINSSNNRRSILHAQGRLRNRIVFSSSRSKSVFDGRGQSSQRLNLFKQVHGVILRVYLVGDTRLPSSDLVKGLFHLVVSGFTQVHLSVTNALGPTSLVPCEEHDKTLFQNLVHQMVSVLARFDHLVLVEDLVYSMNGLFGPVVPACIDPLLTVGSLPDSEDLANGGFGGIIHVVNMNPVTHSVDVTSMLDTVQGKA
jgi:hypothetical protein